MATQSPTERDSGLELSSGLVVPAQRSADDTVARAVGWSSAPTAVLPYVGSPASTRTRRLRAWMVTAPVDLAALLAPLLWTIQYWRGTLVDGRPDRRRSSRSAASTRRAGTSASSTSCRS